MCLPLGIELPDLAAARHEALRIACSKIQEQQNEFWANGGDWQMIVSDERNLTLFALTFYVTNAPVTAFTDVRKGTSLPLPIKRES